MTRLILSRDGSDPIELGVLVFNPNDEYKVLLNEGNTVVIGRDEQGDTYVNIDGRKLWSNSYREPSRQWPGEILFCPHCGNNDFEICEARWKIPGDTIRHWVHCLSCNAEGPDRPTKEKAIEAYNERFNPLDSRPPEGSH